MIRKSRLRIVSMAFLAFTLCAFNLHLLPSRADHSDFQKADPVEQRIKRIENGLLPTIVIKGASSGKMNLAQRMKHYKVPGVSIAVINNFRVEWARGFGVKDKESNAPVTSDTLFQAASISKPVAAMAMLTLVQAGKLNLDEDVNVKLKSWKIPDSDFTKDKKVTLRQLVSHSAGLTVHGFRGYESGEEVPTLAQILKGEKPANSLPVFVNLEPSTKWRYSGGGFCVMQLLMTDIMNKSFPEIMRETVLRKVGMTHSTYQQPLPKEQAAQAATGYRASGEKVKGNWHTYPEMAAAGLWTTPSDLARFAIELQKSKAGKSNKALSQEMAKQMLTVQIANWGLGIGLEGTGAKGRFSHGGANEGFRCFLVAFTDAGQGAVVMTNSDNGNGLAQEILRSIAAEYAWSESFVTEREGQ